MLKCGVSLRVFKFCIIIRSRKWLVRGGEFLFRVFSFSLWVGFFGGFRDFISRIWFMVGFTVKVSLFLVSRVKVIRLLTFELGFRVRSV